jgi:hypothetical protein
MIEMNQDLIERLKHLEKLNKVLFGFLLLISALFVVMLCYDLRGGRILRAPEKLAVQSMKVDALFARSIEVIGDAGKNSISLGATHDGWAGDDRSCPFGTLMEFRKRSCC